MSTIATPLEEEIPGFTIDQAGLASWRVGVDGFGEIEPRVAVAHSIGASIESSFTRRGSPTSNGGLLEDQSSLPAGCPIPDQVLAGG